uniref:AN1-type domain-containing protein n=1 Tax=viral metagenome TaxID=1070528 RepID=A0A6C0AGK0_9ZZZZ
MTMRCEVCAKKVVIVFTCACNKQTCIKHRLPETHQCVYKPELFQLEKVVKKTKLTTI